MKTVSRRGSLLCGTLAIVILTGIAGWWHHLRVEKAVADAFLLAAVGEVGSIERTARLIEEGRVDKAREILGTRLTFVLDSAEEMDRCGGRLYPIAYAMAADDLRRLRERAERNGRADLASRATKLDERLEANKREGLSSWLGGLL